MKTPIIHPSVLGADHACLKEQIEMINPTGAAYFHIDIMDGAYVPNFGLGTEVIKTVDKYAAVPLDIHLMVQNPAKHIDFCLQFNTHFITIHPEADYQPAETLLSIKEKGIKAGIALNPGTSAESVRELLHICDHVLVMTVNPGFGGRAFLEFTLDKIKTLGELAAKHGFSLAVDGDINAARIKQLLPMGVTNFVMGTALFKHRNPPLMIADILKGE